MNRPVRKCPGWGGGCTNFKPASADYCSTCLEAKYQDAARARTAKLDPLEQELRHASIMLRALAERIDNRLAEHARRQPLRDASPSRERLDAIITEQRKTLRGMHRSYEQSLAERADLMLQLQLIRRAEAIRDRAPIPPNGPTVQRYGVATLDALRSR